MTDPYMRRGQFGHGHRGDTQGECYVKMEAEIEMMYPTSQGCQSLMAATRS